MKRSSVIHKLAALAVFLAWVALMIAMIVNEEFWAHSLPYIVLASVGTMVGTVFLSRYWIKRNSVPSYGSIFVFPFVCAFLLLLRVVIWDACSYSGWDVFTSNYWDWERSDWLMISFGVLWIVCLFPAAAIVIYFRSLMIRSRFGLGKMVLLDLLKSAMKGDAYDDVFDRISPFSLPDRHGHLVFCGDSGMFCGGG
jgi:hypothetical protein